MLNASASQPPAWIQVPKHDADLVVVFLNRMFNYIFGGGWVPAFYLFNI